MKRELLIKTKTAVMTHMTPTADTRHIRLETQVTKGTPNYPPSDELKSKPLEIIRLVI